MHVKEIPKNQWAAFCDNFSRLHEGWPATIEVLEDGAIQTVVRDMAFMRVEADLREGHEDLVCISAGNGAAKSMTHRVTAPSHIELQLTDDGAHEGLRVESENGMTTLVRFKTTILN